MKKFILPLVLTFSVVLTGCANITSMRVNVQMKNAQKYMLKEDYEKAIVKLEKAISIDPKNVDAYILRLICRKNLKKLLIKFEI